MILSAKETIETWDLYAITQIQFKNNLCKLTAQQTSSEMLISITVLL